MIEVISKALMQHVKDNCGDFQFFTEGMTRNFNRDWIEFRKFSITKHLLSKTDRRYTVDLNVLIAVVDYSNIFRLEQGLTLVTSLLTQPVSIDFGCLLPRDDIKSTNYGQIEPDVKIKQATVEQTYVLDYRSS